MTNGHIAIGPEEEREGKKICLIRIHFHNDYIGYILASPDGAFEFGSHYKTPVWRLTRNGSTASLDGTPTSPNHSVKISDLDGKELAHETITSWPVEPW